MQLKHSGIWRPYQEVYIDDHETHTGTMDDKEARAFAYHLIDTAHTLLMNTGDDEVGNLLIKSLVGLDKLAHKEG